MVFFEFFSAVHCIFIIIKDFFTIKSVSEEQNLPQLLQKETPFCTKQFKRTPPYAPFKKKQLSDPSPSKGQSNLLQTPQSTP